MGAPDPARAGAGGGSAAGSDAARDTETIRLWDPLLRVFHWALAAGVAAAWLLGRFGPLDMTLHFWAGYVVLGLLAFRVVWGLIGPAPARFASFLYRPGAVAAYARGLFRRRPSGWRGHNPLGGVFVVALLVAVGAQAITGLFVDPEDYINVGPLAQHVSTEASRTALAWHAALAKVVLALVALHVAAIVFYRLWKREDLVRPMITGRKTVDRQDPRA